MPLGLEVPFDITLDVFSCEIVALDGPTSINLKHEQHKTLYLYLVQVVKINGKSEINNKQHNKK